MVKYCINKYPKGSFPSQKTDGRYINEALYENLRILARRIVDDMTFFGICYSSTLEVGTGKSVFVQQIGEAWTELIKVEHGIELPWSIENIVFKPEDLIERSFKLPKYSCIILDEWEDAHYWSKMGMTLRQFFRKCRQLNLFMIAIIPNLFQMPMGYAISRSVFAVDVRFEGEFERGFFYFYNFDRKKDLYIMGKKSYNYKVVSANFDGKFLGGYTVGEDVYRQAKYKDMIEYDEQKNKTPSEKDINVKIVKQFRENCPDIPLSKLAIAFGVSKRTISRWNMGGVDDDNDKRA